MGLAVVGMAGMALQTYGNVMGAMAQKTQMESAANMEKYNAQVELRRKHMIEQRGKRASIKQAEAGSRLQSKQLARMGASGAVIQTGSPLEVIGKQAIENEKDNLGIGYDTQVAASQAESQAGLHELQADVFQEKGKNLQTAGFISAGQTLLFGGGQQGSLLQGFG